MLEGHEILFIGIGKSSILWYRCALPAMHIGADWVGVRGQPPGIQILTGLVRGDTTKPRYDDYKVVVLQQPYGNAWLKQINSLRARGIKVLYEVDDYLHGVGKQKHHDFAKDFSKEKMKAYELCMRACDGMICSTEYIARRYAKFNRNVFVCRNGLDINRYNLTRPARPTCNVGFAGATGHVEALVPWVNAAMPVLKRHPNTCFVVIGMPELAEPIGKILGDPARALGIPFIPLEVYPAAMCLFDIALAPAANKTWYHGKSDLRWLEAGALRIPIIADPTVYSEIEHGVTGLLADDPEEMATQLDWLLRHPEARKRIGDAAREHVEEKRTADIAAQQWFEVCSAVVGGYESMHAYRLSTGRL